MPFLIECNDRYGRRVRLSEDQWLFNILYDHAIMQDDMESISRTIVRPDFIVRDADFSDRENYYRRGAHRGLPGDYIKVVVEFESADIGTVVTAYPVDRRKPAEDILWRR